MQAHLHRIGERRRPSPQISAHRDDLAEPGLDGHPAQSGDRNQVVHLGGRFAVTVGELLQDKVNLPGRGCWRRSRRELLVGLEAQSLRLHILFRNASVDRQLKPQLGLAFGDVASKQGDCFADHPQVQVETDARDVTGLFATQQVSGTTNLEVPQGDLHAGAKLVVGGDGRESVVGGLRQWLHFVVQEVGVRALASAPHATAQLMQLRESVLIGPVDDQSIGVGDVQPRLDDRRRNEHIVLALPEVDHDLLEHTFRQLTVGDRDARVRHQLGELGSNPIDGGNAVVYEEDLSFAQQLSPDRRSHLFVGVRPHEREDRMPVLRRGRECRHFPNPRNRHL